MEKLTTLTEKITNLIDNKRTLFTQLSDQYGSLQKPDLRNSVQLICLAKQWKRKGLP